MAPGPLVSVDWLREHLGDPDLRLVHVSPDASVYDEAHVPGAVFSELHAELALRGRRPETGDAEREWLVPTAAELSATVHRWGVGPRDRVVFYDDIGQNRQAIRGLWLLRYYRWPRERVHVLDGGLNAWRAAGAPVTHDEPPVRHAEPVPFDVPDPALVATFDEVRAWSAQSSANRPVRILDVRTPEEHRGEDVRARRGGRIPGAVNLPFTEFLREDGTFRTAGEIRALAERATGGDVSTLRATHCQGGIRAALAWFALHELAGVDGVRMYAGSWEEWGNRTDCAVESAG
jgi:thiosulfate/3-mercaptopyruvate sulfurtransferase